MALNSLGLGFLFTAQDLASGVMHKVRSSFDKLQGSTDAFKASAKSAFKEFGVGAAMFGAGALALASLSPALEESKELSHAIALVATEADLAVFPQERMRDVAEELAVKYGKAPVDQAKALYKAVALGANDAAKSQDFLNGVNLLAVAGNADLELSANALGGALNAYGASFDQATNYSDAFFTAMKMGNTTVQDLAASVGRVTSSAANLQIPIQEILGAVSVMTNKGVAAAEAVSGLKEALANVIHPSHDAKAEAARLGIQFNQATLRAKGLQGFLQMITSSSKFTAESFSKLFTSVEGSNAVIQVASGDMAAYNDVMKAMGQSSGATQKGFEIMSETLDFQQKKFEAQKKVALGMIGQVLEPMGAAALGLASRFMEAFTKIPKPVLAFFVKLFVGVATIMTVVGAAIALKAAFVLLAIGAKLLGVTFAGVFAAIWPVVLAIGAAALVFYGFRYAYEKNLGGFGDFIRNAFAKVQLAFQALTQLFTQGGFSGAVMEELNKAENSGVKSFAIKLFLWANRIKNFFSGIATGLSAGLDSAAPTFKAIVDAFVHLGEAIGVLDKGAAQDNLTAWQRWGQVGTVVGKVLAAAIELVAAGIAIVVHGVAFLIEWFRFLDAAGTAVVEEMVAGWDNIVGGVKAVGGAIAGAASAIAGAFTAAYNFVAGIFARIGAEATRAARIIGLAFDIVSIIGGAIGNKISAALAPYVAAVKAFFVGIGNDIADAFNAGVNRISAFFSMVWSAISGKAAEIVAGLLAIFLPIALPIIAIFTAAASAISDAFSEVSDFIGGIFDAISAKASEVGSLISTTWAAGWAYVSQVAGAALGWIDGKLAGVAAWLGKMFSAASSLLGGAATGAANGVVGGVNNGLGSLGVSEQVGAKVQQIQGLASNPAMAPPAPGFGGMPAMAAAGQQPGGVDMGQTNAHLATIAAAAAKEKPNTTIVQIDGENIPARTVRGFSPAPPPQ